MSDDGIQQLLNLMMQKQNEIKEWSRTEMIRELEKIGIGPRDADRVITLADDRGLLGTRPVGRSNRKRYFVKPKKRRPREPRDK